MRRLRLAAPLIAFAAALLAPAGARAALAPVQSFGSYGPGAGQMSEAGRIAFAPDGNLYVADFGNKRIDVFSPSGAFLFAFGKDVNANPSAKAPDRCTAATGCQLGVANGEAGSLSGPEDVAFDESGTVYVADASNNRIAVYSPGGQFIRAFGSKVNANPGGGDSCSISCQGGTAGSEAGQLDEPQAIDIPEVANEGFGSGFLFVAETGSNRVDLFTLGGEFIAGRGNGVGPGGVCNSGTGCTAGLPGAGSGTLESPDGLTYSEATGVLTLSSGANNRLDQISGGGPTGAIGGGVGPGGVCSTTCEKGDGLTSAGSINDPIDVATAPGGNLLVADSGNKRIDEFTSSGTFVRAFGQGVATGGATFQICTATCQLGGEGLEPGAMHNPFGVAVDAGGRIAVLEESGGFARIELFADVVPPTPSPPGPSTPGAPPQGAAPPVVVPIAPAPSNKITLGRLRLNPRTGTATLTVAVPGPGQIVLSGKGVRKVTRAARAAGSVSLPISATGRASAELLAGGRVRLAARVAFTPTGGLPGEATRGLTLKRALR